MKMKKILAAVGLAAAALTVTAAEKKIADIRENMFIAGCHDVILNPKDYKGKLIRLQGMYDEFQADGKTYACVLRRTPGCCGDDGSAGLDFVWPPALLAAADFVKPKVNDWIEVVGEATEDERVLPGVFLSPVSVKILAVRGKELVTR